ncbi:SAM and SH3 domain-containing protein 1 [Nymphon striatum]|nr:SAM and SH3 domain-containing protein 1 [Nymphon striatum]
MKDGSRGFLEGLASRYAEQLRTHYQDVLERLHELWSKMVACEMNRSSQVIDTKSYDATSGNSTYAPGIYSPSSCLSDHEEELIYGYAKFPAWFGRKAESIPKSYSNSKSQNLYDSDGYYSIGFQNNNDSPSIHSPSIKKKSGIGKFLKVLSSKKDKGSPKYSKSQRSLPNASPLVDRGNNSFRDSCDPYRLGSPTEDEKLKIMFLAGEGKIPVRAAVERVKRIESEQRNFAQQENLEVIILFLISNFGLLNDWRPTIRDITNRERLDEINARRFPTIFAKMRPIDQKKDSILSGPKQSLVKWPTEITVANSELLQRFEFEIVQIKVLPNFRKSAERSSGNGHYAEPRYYSDASRGQRSSHFYDEPPYESEDSEYPDTSDKRRKFRCRKNRQDKSKQHRHSSRGEVSREKSSISMNGSSCNNELSPEEYRAHMLARSHPNVNKRLLAHTTCSNPNTPLHHNHPHDISRLSSSCQPSPIYSRNNVRNQGSKYSDYASSPVTPTRQRVGMLNRIKQLASRNSLSADEEVGYSPSSEYDDKDDIESVKPESHTSREVSGRPNTIVGKMKVLRRDVKRKFSKLRSNRGSESEATTTASSSNRSSASADDDPHVVWSGPIIAKAEALVDCSPSPYDHDALKFKKGQIIDVISMPQSGIWKGICENQIGTFKFINVKVNEHEQRKPRKHHKKRYSRKTKPKSVEELLRRINLEQYISVFMLNGYENLELFQDIEDEDLDYLGIVEAEHRAKLITAAELLHDYSGSPDRDHGVSDKINVQPEGNHPSIMETSISFDTVFKHKQSPHDSGCFASSENVQKKEALEHPSKDVSTKKADSEVIKFGSDINSSEGVDSFIVSCMNNLDVTVNCSADNEQSTPNDLMNVNVTWSKSETNGIQNQSQVIDNSSKGECSSKFTHVVPETDISESSASSKVPTKSKQKTPPPIPTRSCIPANIDQLKCSKSTVADNNAVSLQHNCGSIPPIDHRLWHEVDSSNADRCSPQGRNSKSKDSSKGKKSRGLELNLSKKSTSSKDFCSHNHSAASSGNKSSNSNDMCNQALMNQVVHKLNAEGINLSDIPYTDKTGFCGIPPALVQRYTEELDQEMSLMAKILDRIRIIHLKLQGKVGVPNDFLIDSCTSPVINANYSSINDWLISIGLPMYYEGFHQMGYIELDQCSKMTDRELNLCRVQDARHLLKFLRAIDSLRFQLQQT